jgi:hypothetical protein
MARVLLFGTVWSALLAALTVALGPPARDAPTHDPGVQLASPPPQLPRAGQRYPGWTITRAYSAHHMMVVEVQTDLEASAMNIAAQLVEPLQASYDEVLVYVRLPGQRSDDLAARRVQWTKRAGYVESVYVR